MSLFDRFSSNLKEDEIPRGYFEMPGNSNRQAVCSDDECPCPDVEIPFGKGYMYISKKTVEFRQDSPTFAQFKDKIVGQVRYDVRSVSPILMCETAARLRDLNLNVAASDAKYWWETGLLPLRPTERMGKIVVAEDLLNIIRQLLSGDYLPLNFDKEMNDFAKTFLDSGDKGIRLLTCCLRNAFSIRTEIARLLEVAVLVANESRDAELLNLLKNIQESKALVFGIPFPINWMPTLKPILIGSSGWPVEFGWDESSRERYLRILFRLKK